MFRTLSLLSVLILNSGVLAALENYYWKEYSGEIPTDAVKGGKDINGKDVYIGQAYAQNVGLIVVQIYSGVKEVFIPINGVVTRTDEYTKILCGPQENFYWLPSTFDTLYLTLNNKHAVIGGHVDGNGHISIGRITRKGETKIGRILSYLVSSNNAHFFFNDDGREGILIRSYEVLLYRNNTNDNKNLDSLIKDVFQGL